MTVTSLQIADLLTGYRDGSLSPADVIEDICDRIESYPDQAVWISRFSRCDLLAQAEALDGADIDDMPLFGIPFAVKDNIDVAGLPTTAACPEFAYTPDKNAVVVDRLIKAGALVIGKTNLDQFATGLVGVRSPHGAPRSVFNDQYISGGSSSGSAVAVAAGLVSFSLGTDTAGSGRVPAALNNIVGVKPTKGHLSTSGVVPACRSLDCITVFAGTVGDADRVRRIATAVDHDDPYSRADDVALLPSGDFRFGVLAGQDREFFADDEAAGLYDAAVARLEALGGTAVPFDYAPFRDAAALLYSGPWVAERTAAIKGFLTTKPGAIHPVVRGIIEGGQAYSAVDGFEGQYALEALRKRADHEWQKMDIMCLPTCPTTYTVDAVEADPVALNSRMGLYTNFVNLLDCCGVAVPAGFRGDSLPLGVTLIGPAHTDADLAVISDRLHRSLGGNVGATPWPLSDTVVEKANIDVIEVLVVGAHLTGMPLNHQLTDLDAQFVEEVTIAGDYRLFALPDTAPSKPALVRQPGTEGSTIVAEVWRMTPDAYGRFVALIPSPLGIGTVALADGRMIQGFLGEAWAVADAEDVTHFGGWRAYIVSRSS